MGISYPIHIMKKQGLNTFGRNHKHVETQQKRDSKISHAICNIVGHTVNLINANKILKYKILK